jgi:peptidoglycan/xylan/chitin deacetylase (PgdA/CDA1 family)
MKVLVFHNITDPSWFEDTIDSISTRYSFITPNSLFNGFSNNHLPSRGCLLTFDDGRHSFIENAYPVLKMKNINALLFVSPLEKNFWFQEIVHYDPLVFKSIIVDYFDNSYLIKYPLMTILKSAKISDIWNCINLYRQKTGIDLNPYQNLTHQEIKMLDTEGLVEIGAHTVHHPILANESDSFAREEILDSILQLESLLLHPINCFAFPNGRPNIDFGFREIDVLKSSSCKMAFSMRCKDVSIKDNMFSIPRYGITRGNRTFIKAKLLFGSTWSFLKSLYPVDKKLKLYD